MTTQEDFGATQCAHLILSLEELSREICIEVIVARYVVFGNNNALKL